MLGSIMKKALVLSEEEFRLFQKFLVEESGLYFEHDKVDSLRLALAQRLHEKKYTSYREYYNFLRFHPEGRMEMRELLDLLTIGETCFFRNKPIFDALMNHILPEIIAKKMNAQDKTIRVWSAGCSKGDEAYSIAIAIMEALPDYANWNISILGTDINREVLSYAREAIYGKRDVEHLPAEYLQRYFRRRGTSFILEESVKKIVRFESHNLAKDPFTMEGMLGLDIIFCRNVTIYFDLDTTRRIIDNFHGCILDGGYLFIGHAETLWQISDKFRPVEFSQTFVYKKELAAQMDQIPKPFVAVPEIDLEEFAVICKGLSLEAAPAKEEEAAPAGAEPETGLVPAQKACSLYQQAMEFCAGKKYDKALILLDKIITEDKSFTAAYIAKATILANQAKYEEAKAELSKIIRQDNLCLEAYYLLGVLAYKTADLKTAEEQFSKVIYIDPTVALAYFNLGDIFLCRKELDNAAREFANAIKILQSLPKDESLRFGEDFAPDALIRACRNNLEKISKQKNL